MEVNKCKNYSAFVVRDGSTSCIEKRSSYHNVRDSIIRAQLLNQGSMLDNTPLILYLSSWPDL